MKACSILLIFALMTPFVANAVEATLTWTAPTHYTNGEPLPPSHIAGYRVATHTQLQVVTGLSATFNVDPGYHCFIAQTIATNGLESVVAMVCKYIPGGGPPDEPIFVCP